MVFLGNDNSVAVEAEYKDGEHVSFAAVSGLTRIGLGLG